MSHLPLRHQPLVFLRPFCMTSVKVLTPSHCAGIDLCNHQFGEAANCEIRPTASGVQLVTRRAVEAGDECFINYGTLPNDFLLLDYVRNMPHHGLLRATCWSGPCKREWVFAWCCMCFHIPLGNTVFWQALRFPSKRYWGILICRRTTQWPNIWGGAGFRGHGQPARPRQSHLPEGAARGAIPLVRACCSSTS